MTATEKKTEESNNNNNNRMLIIHFFYMRANNYSQWSKNFANFDLASNSK